MHIARRRIGVEAVFELDAEVIDALVVAADRRLEPAVPELHVNDYSDYYSEAALQGPVNTAAVAQPVVVAGRLDLEPQHTGIAVESEPEPQPVAFEHSWLLATYRGPFVEVAYLVRQALESRSHVVVVDWLLRLVVADNEPLVVADRPPAAVVLLENFPHLVELVGLLELEVVVEHKQRKR